MKDKQKYIESAAGTLSSYLEEFYQAVETIKDNKNPNIYKMSRNLKRSSFDLEPEFLISIMASMITYDYAAILKYIDKNILRNLINNKNHKGEGLFTQKKKGLKIESSNRVRISSYEEIVKMIIKSIACSKFLVKNQSIKIENGNFKASFSIEWLEYLMFEVMTNTDYLTENIPHFKDAIIDKNHNKGMMIKNEIDLYYIIEKSKVLEIDLLDSKESNFKSVFSLANLMHESNNTKIKSKNFASLLEGASLGSYYVKEQSLSFGCYEKLKIFDNYFFNLDIYCQLSQMQTRAKQQKILSEAYTLSSNVMLANKEIYYDLKKIVNQVSFGSISLDYLIENNIIFKFIDITQILLKAHLNLTVNYIKEHYKDLKINLNEFLNIEKCSNTFLSSKRASIKKDIEDITSGRYGATSAEVIKNKIINNKKAIDNYIENNLRDESKVFNLIRRAIHGGTIQFVPTSSLDEIVIYLLEDNVVTFTISTTKDEIFQLSNNLAENFINLLIENAQKKIKIRR